ncbi:amino acid adenylation domain-containing protein [Aquimarina rhabdastrellae]
MKELLGKLNSLDIYIDVIDGRLDIQAPKGAMKKGLLEEIKQNKENLIKFITSYKPVPSEEVVTIPKAPKNDMYTVSSAQGRLWFLDQLEKGISSYNMPSVLELNGKLNIDILEKVFIALIERHEALRTIFKEDSNGEVKQIILPHTETNFKLEYTDVTLEDKNVIEAIIQIEKEYAFDLSKGPLIKVTILKIAEDKHIFVCVMHHIISDGWSMEVITKEVFSIYEAYLNDLPNPLTPLAIQYKDYTYWQKSLLEKDKRKEQETYWIQQFEGEIPILELPTNKTRPTIKTYSGALIKKTLNEDDVNKLSGICTSQKSTLFMGFLSIIKILLHRYSGQNDLVIGTPIAGREHPDLLNQIGLFVNTLPLRTQLGKEDNFKNVLSKLRKTTLDAYKYQSFPYDEIVEKVVSQRDTSRNPLFDVLVSLEEQEKLPEKEHQIGNLQTRIYNLDQETVSKFDLEFTFSKTEKSYDLVVRYNTDIYESSFIERLITHFERITHSIVDGEDEVSIGTLALLTKEEENQLLYAFNDTEEVFTSEKTIIDLFEEQVKKTPEAIAVQFEKNSITYKELNEQSNQLAYYLREIYKVVPEDLIGIKFDRDEYLIISVLAVLKSGAAYLPIDTTYPEERIKYIENDSKSKVIVDSDELTRFEKVRERFSKENLDKINTSSNLAYIIYTSGSTGYPKGVMVEHASVINLIQDQSRRFEIVQNEVILLFSNFAFDASIEQIFLGLLNGAGLVVASESQILNTDQLPRILNQYGVTHLHATPNYLKKLEGLGRCTTLKRIISGGEFCDIGLARKMADVADFYNEYGPTETTVTSLIHKFETKDYETDLLPIGIPLANTSVYVLSKDLQLQPIGVIGELHISGVGVSRGYLNRPELTREKFIANPYKDGELVYKTGDLVKWLPNGKIEFLGRKDNQVKLRGYRIELGEIDNTILSFSDKVSQVTTVLKKNQGGEALVTYYLEDSPIVIEDLKAFLKIKLPGYMVPNHFQAIESMPLTPNGKIDRNLLEGLSMDYEGTSDYVAPRNKTEEELVWIWQEVLGVDKVGIEDNFFELGGHSLMIGQIINHIYKKLNGSISYKDFFQSPTISQISSNLKKDGYKLIPKAPESQSYPLTPSQHRLWVLSQLDEGSSAYNMPGVIKLHGSLDIDKFKEAIKILVNRHEILRTCFKANGEGEIEQYIKDFQTLDFDIAFQDFEGKSKEVTDTFLRHEHLQVFDLSKGPLLKASLLKLSEDTHLFSFVLHHIIGDGWSMELIMSEVVRGYNNLLKGGEVLTDPLELQYKDYAVWLRSELKGEAYKTSEAYWLKNLSGDLPVLELPSFKKRPLIQTYNGKTLTHRFSEDFTQKIKAFSQDQGVTLFMTLMSGINALLYRYTGQRDIILGTPVAGREHPDLEDQIGLYLNTLAIRTGISEGFSFADLLQQQKQTLLEAYEHQLYPFDDLVGKLGLKRDTSRSVLFDVMVVLQNQSQLETISAYRDNLEGVVIESYELDRGASQFDLSFTFVEEEALSLRLEYNTDIYDGFLIERIFGHFENLLNIAITDVHKQLELIYYSTEEETKQLLEEFNDTRVSYPKDKTIIDVFNSQVVDSSSAIALVFEDKQLSYQALNEVSNQLANYLLYNYDLGSENIIGVKLEHSEWIIISIMAVLKSGCAYLPLDLTYPEDRIAYMESDCNCKIIIDKELINSFEKGKPYSSSLPDITIKPSNLAYVMYTSGSTGVPKGVMVEHGNILSLVKASNYYQFSESDVLLSTGAFSFDATTFEYWGSLLNGGCLVLCSKNVLLDNGLLSKEIDYRKANVMWFTSGWFNQLIDTTPDLFSSLSTILVGGDKLSPKHIGILKDKYPHIQIINGYGPTENTTFSLTYDIPEEKDNIPIGYPISNSTAYILSDSLGLQPIGVIGEISLGGDGLSRGYMNQPLLTREKFVDSPFTSDQKLYKTGDLGRWLPDGKIEFLGRKDNQIKLRGYRIELGEIDNTILSFSDKVSQVTTVLKKNQGGEALVTYYLEDSPIVIEDLKAFLKIKLPGYMVPNHFQAIESMPLTPNGKIDRNLLEGLSMDYEGTSDYVAPRNKTEEELVWIWQEVLGVDKVGIEDNFFELGGHSLMIGQIINHIYKKLNGSISYKDFFQSPTISQISSNLKKDGYKLIPKAPESQSYPLTPSQHRLWVLSQLDEGSSAYNMPGVIKLHGSLDIDKFKEAIKILVNRHEILRTCFKANGEGEIEQYIKDFQTLDFDIAFQDFEGKSKEVTDTFLRHEHLQVFDLSKGPLLKASLLKLSEDTHLFSFVLHHIIGDGWSMELIMSEVVRGYNNLLKGGEVLTDPLELQYKDYAVWLRSELKREEYKTSEAYWLKNLSGDLPVLELPSFKKRPLIQTYNGKTLTHRFSEDFTQNIKAFSQDQGVTLFMTLMSGINALLYRYTGQRDIILGTPVAGREHPDLEDQIGLYLNTLAIRTGISEGFSFADLLQQQKQTLLEAYEHQLYPFDDLVGKLGLKRDTSRSALFDVLVILQNQSQLQSISSHGNGLEDIKTAPYDLEQNTSQFDLSFTFIEEDTLSLNIQYNTDIYDQFLIVRIFSHFENLLSIAISNSNVQLESVDYLTSEEANTILYDFNDTKVDYPKDKTLIGLFEQQVNKSAESIAVQDNFRKLTYEELNTYSNKVTAYIETNISKEERVIGVILDRTINTLVVLLGILKSGRSYIPIDPTFPEDRLRYIIADSGAKTLICDHEYSFVNKSDYSLIKVEDILHQSIKSPIFSNLSCPEDTAYIIYTSGSTGNPKGVEVGHASLINFLLSIRDQFEIGNNDILYAITTYSFDISILEFFVPLISGGKVFIADHDTLSDIGKLILNIEEVKPTIIQGTPGFYQLLCDGGWKGDKNLKVLCGGDSLKTSLASQLLDVSGGLWNMYGPTETTIWSSVKPIKKKEEALSIGSPIANTQVYILGDKLELLPTGVSGKLYISGEGLAKGYLNRMELTAQKFIPSPFEKGKVMYDTGDLAKWHLDGNIEFLGRNDHQVKLRGYRIELGEIDHTILSFSDEITQAITIVNKAGESEVLVSFYIEKSTICIDELKAFLKTKLPSYMIPVNFKAIESMPLTPNRKIDRKSLGNILIDYDSTSDYIAPRNQTEEQLVSIWQEVLGVERVGIEDSFFDLGGNSLMIGQIINHIYKALNRRVSYRDFFQNPTISQISNTLKSSMYKAISVAPKAISYPLTPSQHRLWVLSQLEGGSSAYNIPGVIKFQGVLNIDKFKKAIGHVIKRHEILRTCFKTNEEGAIEQFIKDFGEVISDINVHDFTDQGKEETDAFLKEEHSKVFDLSIAPLFRACLLKLKEEEYLFSFVLHHIIGDGWSMELIASEVISLYNTLRINDSVKLQPLSIQYKDYAVWLQSQLKEKKYKTSEAYWLQKFSGDLPVLELPSFKKRPLIQTYKGNRETYRFSKDFTQRIKTFSKEEGVTLFMTLLSGINALLYRYTNQNDIIIGTPVAGREHPDLENQIGLYLNTLAIRTKIAEEYSFFELLQQQKQTLLEAYEHQLYPFDDLISKLDLKRDTSRSALFDVLVVLQNQSQLTSISQQNDQLEDIFTEPYQLHQDTSQFDVSFTFIELEECLSLSIEYNTDIYDQLLIIRFFEHFENLLRKAISGIDKKIQSIDYLTPQESSQLMEGGNTEYDNNLSDKTLIDLFEEQVEKTPDGIAVVFGEKEFTYNQINERSNQLASFLREVYKVQPEDLIGVKLERSENLFVTILGVLKSGAAYIPIDINYPEERISYIEKDSGCKIIIDADKFEAFIKVAEGYSKKNVEKLNAVADLAYIIYTSGSTGKPKGVMIEHRNAVAMLEWSIKEFIQTPFDVLYAVTSHCFDLSVFEMFYPLIIGKKIRILENGLFIQDYITIDKNVFINTVPSVIHSLLKKTVNLDNIVAINMAGEPIPIELSNDVNKLNIEARNLYGPSEDTTYSSCFRIKNSYDKSIPIGKPIDNTQFYILSDGMQLQPYGVIGEIYISGLGVSRGYLNNPDLTKKKFISHPFIEDKLVYKTGDLARWLPDGNIEFIGRKDGQVKVRGYRIELGEIENVLVNQNEIEQAVVTIKRNNESAYIISYIVASEPIDKQKLRFKLSNILPDYMLPNYYVILDQIPLTPNGKVDKDNLPEVSESDILKREYIAPRNELETDLVRIWEGILGIEKIGVTDNFFELGGNSINATKLLSVIYKKFDVKIEIEQVFVNPTIEYLAVNIENTQWLDTVKTNESIKKITI